MGLSAIAANLLQMVAFRAFAGLFIGAIVSSLNIIVSEYSSDKRRGTVMGIYGIGLPAGVAMGGAITGALISMFSWHAPFVFSAVITAIMARRRKSKAAAKRLASGLSHACSFLFSYLG
jgi:MFS family permease